MQDHGPRAQFDTGEVLVPRDNVHEIGELDPEDVFESEELGPRVFVQLVDFCRGEEDFCRGRRRGEEGRREGLGHGVAELAPEGAVVVHGGGVAGPGGVCGTKALDHTVARERFGNTRLTLRKLQVVDGQDWRGLDVCNPPLPCHLWFAIGVQLLGRDCPQR